jgi:hypothetical protein
MVDQLVVPLVELSRHLDVSTFSSDGWNHNQVNLLSFNTIYVVSLQYYE